MLSLIYILTAYRELERRGTIVTRLTLFFILVLTIIEKLYIYDAYLTFRYRINTILKKKNFSLRTGFEPVRVNTQWISSPSP